MLGFFSLKTMLGFFSLREIGRLFDNFALVNAKLFLIRSFYVGGAQCSSWENVICNQ